LPKSVLRIQKEGPFASVYTTADALVYVPINSIFNMFLLESDLLEIERHFKKKKD